MQLDLYEKHAGKRVSRRNRLALRLMFLFLTIFSMAAGADSQSRKVTYSGVKVPLAQVFAAVKQQTGYVFFYDESALNGARPVNVQATDVPLETFLTLIFKDQPLEYTIENKAIVVTPKKEILNKEISRQRDTLPSAIVKGKVTDNRNQPLPGVSVRVRGGKGTVTQVDGTYSLMLTPGKYTLEFSFISYGTRRITDVEASAKSPALLNVVMTPASSSLKEVVITTAYKKASVEGLYAMQKNNAAISDGISAEQISQTPDNNAAQVLKRVNGLTIQDDKFVTVRGLSDRYNNVLLNGSVLPSTEPNRRNFSFDIIPSGMIDNIIVNKTATPDLPAEFAGGLVQIATKDVPDRDFASITLGSGYNTNTVGRSLYGLERGKNDFLGYDDGTRSWWRNGTWDRHEYAAAVRAGDHAKMSEMNQRIPNNWGLQTYRYNPVQNYQLHAGKKIALRNGHRVGITAGLTYRHDERIEDEERRTYLGDQNQFFGNSSFYRSALGGLLNAAYVSGKHKIVLENLYNHLFTSETSMYEGRIEGFGGTGDVRSYTDITLINDVRHHRLKGEHAVGGKGIRLDWSGDWVNVQRSQPDTRNLLGFRAPGDPEGYYYYNFADGTGFLGRGASIYSSYLEENRYSWAANITLPFMLGGKQQKIKAGYNGAYRQADFQSVGMLVSRYTSGGAEFDKVTKGMSDREILSPAFYKPGYLYNFITGPRSSEVGDDYTGVQRLNAGYAMLDLNFLEHFRLIGGVRAEHNYAEVSTVTFRRTTGEPVDSVVVFKKTDWLPSANLVYSLNPKMNIRLAYAETLSRPDFRERSPFIYYEFRERVEYKGAFGLKDARIHNMDLRYEWYPAAGEVVSASVFYKKLDSPVELVVGGTQGGAQIYYYFNLRNSTATGVEVDFRKTLGFINPASGFLKNMFIAGNGSWMKANVRYNTEEMLRAANSETGSNLTTLPPDSRNRPLQGLSPYVINGSIGYAGKPVGVTVSYNRYGRRIVAGGLYPYSDQYENPRDVLDLQVNARLLKDKLELRLNLADLLQQSFVIYDNVKLNSNGGIDVTETTKENVNDDPRGAAYNPALDYTRYKSFRGTNVSFNVTYNF